MSNDGWGIRDEIAAATHSARHRASRIVRRIPTIQEQQADAWRAQERWTRELMRELARVGYDIVGNQVTDPDDEPADSAVRLYLDHVGAENMSMILRVSVGGRVTRVLCGKDSFTARQAALWLRKRAPRERKYL